MKRKIIRVMLVLLLVVVVGAAVTECGPIDKLQEASDIGWQPEGGQRNQS